MSSPSNQHFSKTMNQPRHPVLTTSKTIEIWIVKKITLYENVLHLDNRRKSNSMYEILNWGSSNGSCTNGPKRLQLSIIGNEINIDDPPTPPRPQQHHQQSHSTPTTTNFHYNYKKPGMGWSWSIFSTIFYYLWSHVITLVRSKVDICMEWTFFICDFFTKPIFCCCWESACKIML